jgi:hypothetical protein
MSDVGHKMQTGWYLYKLTAANNPAGCVLLQVIRRAHKRVKNRKQTGVVGFRHSPAKAGIVTTGYFPSVGILFHGHGMGQLIA